MAFERNIVWEKRRYISKKIFKKTCELCNCKIIHIHHRNITRKQPSNLVFFRIKAIDMRQTPRKTRVENWIHGKYSF